MGTHTLEYIIVEIKQISIEFHGSSEVQNGKGRNREDVIGCMDTMGGGEGRGKVCNGRGYIRCMDTLSVGGGLLIHFLGD